jgi:hypothetical protein
MVVFFSIAAWNVGLVNSPTSNWQVTQNENFYVDLGSLQHVSNVYFWVKMGNASVEVYSGTPDNWIYAGQFVLQPSGTDYSGWRSCSMSVDTQYLYFKVAPVNYDSRPNFWWNVPNPSDKEPTPFAEVSEIGVINQNNQQLPIVGITADATTDSTLSKLVDEQSLVEVPPTYMSQTYFDEVYFVKAAENYVNHQISYERTHPPLGKLIQAAGIAIFGDTPFGWRIMGVIFGTLMIPIMYVMGKKLFGTWIGGFAAAFLLSFDFMHFSMARMGTADTYVVFFSLLSQLCFLFYFMNVAKNGWKTSVLPLVAAVFFFALGFSTKWAVLYGAIGMLALLAGLRIRDLRKLKGSLSAKYAAFFDHPFLLIIGCIGVVALIYFLTYLPDMIAGDSFSTIFHLQFAMYDFHSTLAASHQIAWDSPWWSWPFIITPLWLAVSYIPNTNNISTIMLMGNPAVWWIGFAAVLFVTERAIRGKESVLAIAHYLKTKLSKKPPAPPAAETLAPAPEGTPPEASSAAPVADVPAPDASPAESAPVLAPEPALPVEAAEAAPAGRSWDLAAIFIATLFFFQWLPWMLISRVTFIYHFYACVPFLCLASAYFINKMWTMKYGKAATIIYLIAVVAVFVLFYSVISGLPTSSSWIASLKLLGKTWLRP